MDRKRKLGEGSFLQSLELRQLELDDFRSSANMRSLTLSKNQPFLRLLDIPGDVQLAGFCYNEKTRQKELIGAIMGTMVEYEKQGAEDIIHRCLNPE